MRKKILLSAALIAVSFTTFAQVGVGTTTPDASAILDVTSTTQGFLPPRMSEAQMNSIASPAEGIIVYCLDCTQKGLYMYDGTRFNNIATGTPANSVGVNDIVSATGLVWADRNLGATQVATSSTDAAAYGDLYQWGRVTDGHQLRTSATTVGPVVAGSEGVNFITVGAAPYDWLTVQDDNRWYGEASANNPCPSGYRVPSDYEWQAERNTWVTKDATGAYSALKLPVAGFRRHSNGTLYYVGSIGGYWSSTASGTDARYLHFNSSTADMRRYTRATGFSVRCIKD